MLTPLGDGLKRVAGSKMETILGKRTAFVYLYFNLTGAVILMSGFYLVNTFVDFGIMHQTATSMGIAIVNTVFKVAATAILAPFASLLEKLAILTIKESGDNQYQILLAGYRAKYHID